MRKFAVSLVAAAAACVGICQTATAADMALKAPPPAPVLAPTWTGFYVGGNVGSAWGQDDTSVNINILGLGIGAPLTSQGIRNFVGGVQGGYNYQFGSVVLGIEADADWGNVKGTAPCVIIVSCRDRIKSFGDVGGRAGVVVDK